MCVCEREREGKSLSLPVRSFVGVAGVVVGLPGNKT